jgi:GntR family transcriptional regulator
MKIGNFIEDVKNPNLPHYKQLEEAIKALIVNGKYMPGDLLPSIRGLATDNNLSVLTTKRAYDELQKVGLLEVVQGKGTYVSGGKKSESTEEALIQLDKLVRIAVNTCKNLGYKDEEITEIVRKKYVENIIEVTILEGIRLDVSADDLIYLYSEQD